MIGIEKDSASLIPNPNKNYFPNPTPDKDYNHIYLISGTSIYHD